MIDLVHKQPHKFITREGFEKSIPITRVRRLPANKYSKTYMDIVNRAKQEETDESGQRNEQ